MSKFGRCHSHIILFDPAVVFIFSFDLGSGFTLNVHFSTVILICVHLNSNTVHIWHTFGICVSRNCTSSCPNHTWPKAIHSILACSWHNNICTFDSPNFGLYSCLSFGQGFLGPSICLGQSLGVSLSHTFDISLRYGLGLSLHHGLHLSWSSSLRLNDGLGLSLRCSLGLGLRCLDLSHSVHLNRNHGSALSFDHRFGLSIICGSQFTLGFGSRTCFFLRHGINL
mmetsp:Transcript_91888/g.159402  ORF Transcript_91888/g.159402 Transcript_91888/m.159402 type:complete len:225 (-) Transcript_91888:129-803(-)